MKFLFFISIFIYIFFLISPANAGKIDLIIDIFKGGKKLITKGDEVTDTGKAIENLKGGSKIDETTNISSQLDEISSVKYNENTINEIENLNNEEIFEKHGIKKLKNLDGVIDIIDGVIPVIITTANDEAQGSIPVNIPTVMGFSIFEL